LATPHCGDIYKYTIRIGVVVKGNSNIFWKLAQRVQNLGRTPQRSLAIVRSMTAIGSSRPSLWLDGVLFFDIILLVVPS